MAKFICFILFYYLMVNQDELYVLEVAQCIPGVEARLATPEENYGHRKADIVITYKYGNIEVYLQVSRQPKSKGALEGLERRGTYAVHTHTFPGIQLPRKEIEQQIREIINRYLNHRRDIRN
jgi:hypothetical protein